MSDIYALLSEKTALQIFDEAGAAATSPTPVVRAIIDENLGFVYLAKSRPVDDVEERIIRLETDRPDVALKVLASTPGVARIARSPGALICV